MAARTKARKRALDVLFEADQRRANVLTVLEERLRDSGAETPLPEYSESIVRGVASHWADIEAILAPASLSRSVDRMPAVDRALARIATWEIRWNDDVPAAVAVSEAIELATALSTDDSPGYLNGVLGAIAGLEPTATGESPVTAAPEIGAPDETTGYIGDAIDADSASDVTPEADAPVE